MFLLKHNINWNKITFKGVPYADCMMCVCPTTQNQGLLILGMFFPDKVAYFSSETWQHWSSICN